jgi:hypothetical protein
LTCIKNEAETADINSSEFTSNANVEFETISEGSNLVKRGPGPEMGSHKIESILNNDQVQQPPCKRIKKCISKVLLSIVSLYFISI